MTVPTPGPTPGTTPSPRPARGRIRVLVVDDSLVIRRLVVDALTADPQIQVVGVAPNGRIALEKVAALSPDAVTMDIEMPEMNGIEAVRALRRTHPKLPVVMFSTLTERAAAATLDALAAGASDYVTKPSNVGSFAQSQREVREQLVPKLKALTGARRAAAAPGAGAATASATSPGSGPQAPARRRSRTGPFAVLAVGCSTGGPDALATVLPVLPADLQVPVVVVQHMPPVFTRLLAERLNGRCGLTVAEAQHGEPLVAGRILIAPGGRHLVVRRHGTQVVAELTDAPPENFCRPAVDVLFRSVSAAYGERVLAAVLTGMGRDGERGASVIRGAGGEVWAQDEATSVVWGMPGAVTTAGQADRVLPLAQIGQQLAATLAQASTPAGVAP
jgi:two-component system, chemotaxis family, protein-glutamate methylesterase/glutaminase